MIFRLPEVFALSYSFGVMAFRLVPYFANDDQHIMMVLGLN